MKILTISCPLRPLGVIYALFLWAAPDARNTPKITKEDALKFLPVGLCAAGAHAGSVFALGAGAVSFAQIVKSAEPVFAAVIGTLVYKNSISLAKWLCLIPVIGGVVRVGPAVGDAASRGHLLLAAHRPPPNAHHSPLTTHVSRLAARGSRLAARGSRLASRVSRLASRVSRLASHVLTATTCRPSPRSRSLISPGRLSSPPSLPTASPRSRPTRTRSSW